ncbi:MAG: hypothetical protein HY906_02130 [Deltaproteobacteria bacterium]|nr:hypothetical protein [Deltaproteobacteria bacterium]
MRPRLLGLAVGLITALALASCVVASGAGGDDGDGGARDAVPDGRPGDAPAADAPVADAPAPDGSDTDAPTQADAAQSDAGQQDGTQDDAQKDDAAQSDAAQSDAAQSDASTACTQIPATPGVYSYTTIPLNTLPNLSSNPPIALPAVAWHPDGAYALALAYSGRVIRFTAATSTVDQVADLGSTTQWKHASFTADGSKAVLLAWDSGASTGRIHLWDHAGGTVAEMSGQAAPGIYYESLAWSPGGAAKLLGRNNNASNYIVYLWPFDATSGRDTAHVYARNTAAGCQDLAYATDQYDATAIAVTCGINWLDVFHIDSGGQYHAGPTSIGNVSRIAGRPQGDYALAVGWSGNGKLYRFKQGQWDAPYMSPQGLGGYQVGFSSDGRRALMLGGYGDSPAKGQVYEYVHDTYGTWDSAHVLLMDVSIPNFNMAPWAADSSVELNDVAFRPGCEQGLIVGGSASTGKGYIIRFTVDNGCTCPG